jgi:CO/xanthine dehydrogenase FAD-binding subunit
MLASSRSAVSPSAVLFSPTCLGSLLFNEGYILEDNRLQLLRPVGGAAHQEAGMSYFPAGIPFVSPLSLQELQDLLPGIEPTFLAGGTDLIPRLRAERTHVSHLVDLSNIPELLVLETNSEGIQIGAAVTYAQLVRSETLGSMAPALVAAASLVGSIQVRNRGTIGGCLGNASPAADLAPPLYLHEAVLHLMSPDGERRVAIEEFWLGPGETALNPGEIIQSIEVKSFKGGARFKRVARRLGPSCAVVNCAVGLRLDDPGYIADVRIALGAVGPTPLRCREAEASLRSERPDPKALIAASRIASNETQPIDDLRASAAYRKVASERMVLSLLSELSGTPVEAW